MRRILGAAAALTLMTAMAGCGGSDGGTAAEPAGQAGGDKITMGFAQVGAESGWRTANDLEEAAARSTQSSPAWSSTSRPTRSSSCSPRHRPVAARS